MRCHLGCRKCSEHFEPNGTQLWTARRKSSDLRRPLYGTQKLPWLCNVPKAKQWSKKSRKYKEVTSPSVLFVRWTEAFWRLLDGISRAGLWESCKCNVSSLQQIAHHVSRNSRGNRKLAQKIGIMEQRITVGYRCRNSAVVQDISYVTVSLW